MVNLESAASMVEAARVMYWPNLDAKWETCVAVGDFYWKQITEPVMSLYTETTDGSFIDSKESTLVWNYQYADPDFGSCQAKELLDQLESVLANEPGLNKGLVAERLLETMQQKGTAPDFVLCIGDDRSDENMFKVVMSAVASSSLSPVAEVFACTVRQKPSKAKYYLEDTMEILRMLQGLASGSEHCAKHVSISPQRIIIKKE
ncbi:putative alpha,alpha-trehalose-phosphate synthase [UDP-forming] 10 [Capsicum chinense]|nr:putative alpha,alpha-trehalose-phosphate synthase [UDP-forming] 10 [Capsicum chinense]